jgi:hypothetical protein
MRTAPDGRDIMRSGETTNLSILTSNRIASPAQAEVRSGALYLGMSAFMIALMIAGFWPSYFGPLLRGEATRPWVIHIHGAVFAGWMALLLIEVILVSMGRIRQHRAIGKIGMVYGCLVFITGVIAAFAGPVLHVKNGEWSLDHAAGFLLISLRAITVFGGFFLAAMVFRRKPELHKRLILLATVALLFAPVGRLNPPAFLVVWLAPVFIAMLHDRVKRERVHRVFVIGLVVLIVGFTPIVLWESESYLKVGRTLLGLFL